MTNKNLVERSLKAVWNPCSQMKQYEALPLILLIGVRESGSMILMIDVILMQLAPGGSIYSGTLILKLIMPSKINSAN